MDQSGNRPRGRPNVFWPIVFWGVVLTLLWAVIISCVSLIW